MKWIPRFLTFIAALSIGIFAASLFWDGSVRAVTSFNAPVPTTLGAGNLLGTWKGSWGYNGGECTLEIYRGEGTNFYGTLRKEGAEIRFEGTFDPQTREIFFEETKVVTLGAHMSEWSLGKNSGTLSRDGRILVGTGQDKWGEYGWAASNY